VPILLLAARHARLCLVLGLVAGTTLPGLADTLKPWLPTLVALLLLLSALRIGPHAAFGKMTHIRRTLAILSVYQIALPVAALALFVTLGMAQTTVALVIVLLLAAPSISGSPNFTALMGHDPAPPMRLLILGTAVFPFTVLPIFWLAPGTGDPDLVLQATLRLITVILIAAGVGFSVRFLWKPTPKQITAIDGASALTLGVIVIGLMAAVAPALTTQPFTVGKWLALAFAVNFGLQVIAYKYLNRAGEAIVAGNRNIALYLVALPESVIDPLLVFVGCYQIPMYLTPILMARYYRT
jgi:predicted Na+-dependent transporter